jgi:hypothetical protein
LSRQLVNADPGGSAHGGAGQYAGCWIVSLHPIF